MTKDLRDELTKMVSGLGEQAKVTSTLMMLPVEGSWLYILTSLAKIHIEAVESNAANWNQQA